MAARYDVESFFAEIAAIIQADLNTKITAITTEKADNISLGSIADAAIYFQTLDDSIANFDNFVIYGLSDIQVDSTQTHVIENITADVAICFSTQNTIGTGQRALRYTRALKEIFTEAWAKNKNNRKFKVESLAPTPVRHIMSGKKFQAVGVRLAATIG